MLQRLRLSIGLTSVVLSSPVCHAQVENGSFEEGGMYWDDPCGQAGFESGGATGCGESHAVLPLFYSGSPCDAATAGMILQRLPWVQSGDVLEVSFWYRGIAEEEEDQDWVSLNCLMAAVDGTGHLVGNSDPGSEMAFFVGDTDWQYLHRSIEYTLNPGDTAVIALGGSGFSYATGVMHFDDVHVSIALNTATHTDATTPMPQGWFDGAYIHVRTGTDPLQVPALNDAIGRTLQLAAIGSGAETIYGTGDLLPGTYAFRANTERGPYVLRFIK